MHFKSSALLSVTMLAVSIAASSLDAGQFRVINRSNKRVYVVLHHRASSNSSNLEGAYSFGEDSYSEFWTTWGWQVIHPGQSKVVYDGGRDRIYVRMTFDSGLNGPVIRPRKHMGETRQLVHGNRFEISRHDHRAVDSRYFAKIGPEGTTEGFHSSAAQLLKICRRVGGFYRMKSNTNFTVNQPPAPQPQPSLSLSPTPAPPVGNPSTLLLWRGVFNSNYGRVSLTPNGSSLTGVVTYSSGKQGQLQGSVQGGVFRFQWRNQSDHGRGELRMRPGGRELEGWFVDQRGNSGGWRLWR